MFGENELPEPRTSDAPLVVHVTRVAALLTLFGGVIMLMTGSAEIGIAIILLSALYVALAEIIRYLAVIACRSRPRDE